jgi:hypothetical protein
MRVALDEISARGGRWVGLEVRADNFVAARLYEHLNFKEVGRTLHMLRPAGMPRTENPPPYPALRRARGCDSAALIDLVYAVIPGPHRPLLELRRRDYRLGWERTLNCWLDGRHEVWWVIEEEGVLHGAVRALRERRPRPNRLEVLLSPGHGERLASVLIQRGVSSSRDASRKMIDIVLPGPTEPLIEALEAAGFERTYVLVQMRLDLVHRIPIRSRR